MADFYEEFQANVVDENAHCYNKEVANKLRPTTHFWFFETDISTQPKTTEKSYRKREYERCNMCADGNRAYVQHIVTEYEIVENEV